MISIFSNHGRTNYGIKEYVMDVPEDVETLSYVPTAGSTAYAISTGETYMVNKVGEWRRVSVANSGSSDGVQGQPGESAYEIAVRHGFIGTEQEWLDSLQGSVVTIGEDNQWYIDGEPTGVNAQVSNYDDLENLPTLNGEPLTGGLTSIKDEDIDKLFPTE